MHCKVLLKKLLPVNKLSNHRLRAGHVSVTLDPHAANRFPLTTHHALLDAFENARVVIFDPLVVLGRRRRKDEVVMLIHQAENVAKGPGTLANSFSNWP